MLLGIRNKDIVFLITRLSLSLVQDSAASFSNFLLLKEWLNSFDFFPRPLFNKLNRFRLFPFRSPLLRKSRLLSFPLLTKMFQFSKLPLTYL
jgi:hypothetical protein